MLAPRGNQSGGFFVINAHTTTDQLEVFRMNVLGLRRFPVGVVWLGWWMALLLVGGMLPAQGQAVTAPQFAPSSYPNGILNVQLDENQSGEQARGVLLSSVVARGVSPITYSIVENVMGAGGANLYAVDPPTRGNIYYRGPALDFEAPGTVRHSITVRASNLIGHDDLTVNITVRNVNEPPAVEVMLPDLNLKDGGTERVDLRRYFVDPDENDVVTYTAVSDRPDSVFARIGGSTLFLTARGPGNAFVEVTATDRAGVSAPGIHSFQVLVVANSRPVIDRAGVAWDNLLGAFRYTLNENVDGSDNAVIVSQGLFMAADADVGDRIRWSLEGPDEELEGFQINSTGRLTYRGEGLDFENKRTHTFYVVASDGAAMDRVQVIVQVLNRLEPPQLATELEDVTLPITTSALAIDLAENFAESDAGETFIYSVASDRAEVEAWILGVAGSSRIVLVPRFEGEAIIEVCVTDEDITVPDPSLVQADRITYNTQLHTACRASSSRIVETFDVDVVPPDVFSDDNGTTHEININKLSELQITRGCNPPTNSRYCPDSQVTRGQMATFLVRALGIPRSSSGSRFVDISNSTHVRDINALANSSTEITQGCNPPVNNRYCPDRPISRGEMATFLVRGFGLADLTYNRLTDIANSTHRANIMSLAAAGITRGCNAAGTEFCPNRSVTRGEMASFLVRALDL